MLDHKEKPPEHMANSFYLEWFSESNGRVVIESADYELSLSSRRRVHIGKYGSSRTF
jgi:hypothetical protein